MLKLPSYRKALDIVEKSNAFYKKHTIIEEQEVTVFDYRLASITDFIENEALELRGLTFVKNKEGVWTRNILLNKFFNINETKYNTDTSWMYEDIKDKKIIEVSTKEDGSVISFVLFDNGVIRAKSKTSFISDQAVMAQEVFDNSNTLRSFLLDMFNRNCTPIFELVSPHNPIVLSYNKTELVLLQIRDNDTGEYFPTETIELLASTYNVNIAERLPLKPLEYWLKAKETNKEDIEGWVLTFEGGQKAKIKTQKYYELHQLIGPDAFRENLLIVSILNGTIDDITARLDEGERKDFVISITNKVTFFYNKLIEDTLLILDNRTSLDRRTFADTYKSYYSFGVMMKFYSAEVIDEKLLEIKIKKLIIHNNKKLNIAKKWIEELE